MAGSGGCAIAYTYAAAGQLAFAKDQNEVIVAYGEIADSYKWNYRYISWSIE